MLWEAAAVPHTQVPMNQIQFLAVNKAEGSLVDIFFLQSGPQSTVWTYFSYYKNAE